MSDLALALLPVRRGDARFAALPERERVLVPAAATVKRRGEFAAGRTAARFALERLLGPEAQGATIEHDCAGTARPVARSRDGARLPVHVSITHAGGLAAAAVAREPLGIDLVSFEPLGSAFLEEAFAPGELAGWRRFAGVTGSRAACIGFAAKEAALKWLGAGLTVPLASVAVAPAGPVRRTLLGRVAAIAFALDVEVRGATARLEGAVACSARRVLFCALERGS